MRKLSSLFLLTALLAACSDDNPLSPTPQTVMPGNDTNGPIVAMTRNMYIGADVDRLTSGRLFRCHEPGRPDGDPVTGDSIPFDGVRGFRRIPSFTRELRHAPVEHQDLTKLTDHDVRRFEVAMDHAA